MRSLANIFLAILLLIGTFGVTISKHYCGGHVHDIAINKPADACGMEDDMPTGCCHNESEHFGVEDEFQLQNFEADVTPNTFVLYSIAYFISNSTLQESKTKGQFLTAIPPPLSEPDIYIKVQSFLL